MGGTGTILQIACVLRTGGCYNRDYVKRLVGSIHNNLDLLNKDYEVVCFTDDPLSVMDICRPIPMARDLPGYWAKLELFRRPGRYLYFDLDTIIQDDITPLAEYNHSFSMLSDFFRNELPASGVMAWNGDYRFLVDEFKRTSAHRYVNGDGEYIGNRVDHERLQELFPSMFASFKKHSNEVKRKAPVVCFHGKPRPHEVDWRVL